MNTMDEVRDYLKNNGYRISSGKTWLHYSKENKIGYIQYDRMEGFSLTSVHKPNRDSGTGFSLFRELSEVTPEHLTQTMNVLTPNWWKGKTPEKYKTFDEFLKDGFNRTED